VAELSPLRLDDSAVVWPARVAAEGNRAADAPAADAPAADEPAADAHAGLVHVTHVLGQASVKPRSAAHLAWETRSYIPQSPFLQRARQCLLRAELQSRVVAEPFRRHVVRALDSQAACADVVQLTATQSFHHSRLRIGDAFRRRCHQHVQEVTVSKARRSAATVPKTLPSETASHKEAPSMRSAALRDLEEHTAAWEQPLLEGRLLDSPLELLQVAETKQAHLADVDSTSLL